MDNLYKTEKNPWGLNPHKQLIETIKNIPIGNTLDVGCGDGKDLLYLDDLGYKCYGIDGSQEALNILKTKNPNIETIYAQIEDIDKALGTNKYMNIISFYTLHFMKTLDALEAISWIKEHTLPGGINLICDFTKNGELYKPDTDRLFLNTNELEKLYDDWEIIDHKEDTTKTKAGPIQGIEWILAKKPSTH